MLLAIGSNVSYTRACRGHTSSIAHAMRCDPWQGLQSRRPLRGSACMKPRSEDAECSFWSHWPVANRRRKAQGSQSKFKRPFHTSTSGKWNWMASKKDWNHKQLQQITCLIPYDFDLINLLKRAFQPISTVLSLVYATSTQLLYSCRNWYSILSTVSCLCFEKCCHVSWLSRSTDRGANRRTLTKCAFLLW